MTNKVISIASDDHFADYAEANEHVVYEEVPRQEQMSLNRAVGVVIVACVVFWVAVGYRIVLLVYRVAR